MEAVKRGFAFIYLPGSLVQTDSPVYRFLKYLQPPRSRSATSVNHAALSEAQER